MFATLFSIVLSYLFFVQTESISELMLTVAIRAIIPDLLVFLALCACSVYVFGALVVLVFSYVIACYYCDFPYPTKYWVSAFSGWLYIYTTAVGRITALSGILWSLLSCFCASQFVMEQHPSFIKKMQRAISKREERASALARGYTLLRFRRNEFRLLRLFPGEGDNITTCALEIFTLDDYPKYEALSYCWGKSLAEKWIVVDGRETKITSSLEIALRHLRHAKEDRLLWIDQLCIDQENLYERGEQVQIMRFIYNSASGVVVWLGPGDNGTDQAMRLVRAMKEIPEPQPVDVQKHIEAWPHLQRIFQFPWWTRVWIVQEIALAKEDPIVGCGREWVPWSYLMNAFATTAFQWTRDSNALPDFFAGILHQESVPILDAIRGKVLRGEEESLEWYLRATCGIFDATDARDKIYALLGLAREKDRRNLSPDYGPSVTEISLYTRVVKHLIDFDSSLNILSFYPEPFQINSHTTLDQILARYRHPHRFNSLPNVPPTWLPNLGFKETYLNPTMPFTATRIRYQACGSLPAKAHISGKGNVLFAKGILFDVVQLTMHHSPCPTNSYLRQVDAFFSTVLAYFDPPEAMARWDTRWLLERSESHWRTMIADKSPPEPKDCRQSSYNPSMISMTPAHPSLGTMYEVLLRGRPVPADADAFYRVRDYFIQPPASLVERYTEPFWRGCGIAMTNRSPFATRCGFLGLGPPKLRDGDVVAILFGADVPFILRPRGEN